MVPFFYPTFTYAHFDRTTSFVTAVDPSSQFPSCLCSWDSDWLDRPCTVVEAVRATTAVTTFFKPAPVRHVIPTTYFDTKVRCNNPTQYVLEKARELYGDRPISWLLSVGTGPATVIERPPSTEPFQQWLPTKLLRTLQDVVTDCHEKSMEINQEFSRHSSSILYCRLDSDRRPCSLADWRTLPWAWRPWNLDLLFQALKGKRAAIHPIQSLTKM